MMIMVMINRKIDIDFVAFSDEYKNIVLTELDSVFVRTHCYVTIELSHFW